MTHDAQAQTVRRAWRRVQADAVVAHAQREAAVEGRELDLNLIWSGVLDGVIHSFARDMVKLHRGELIEREGSFRRVKRAAHAEEALRLPGQLLQRGQKSSGLDVDRVQPARKD